MEGNETFAAQRSLRAGAFEAVLIVTCLFVAALFILPDDWPWMAGKCTALAASVWAA
jgi:hypothetical protein